MIEVMSVDTNKVTHGEVAKTKLAVTAKLILDHPGEAGDAWILAQQLHGSVVYDRAEGRWFRFLGHWVEDKTGQMTRVVYTLSQQYVNAANEYVKQADGSDKTQRQIVDDVMRRYKELQSAARIANVLSLLKDQAGMSVASDRWDSNPWLLGVQNGTLDLRTGMLEDANPVDYIRRVAPVTWYGIDADCPKWEKFIHEVTAGDDAMVGYLQRLAGYWLTGKTTEAIMPIFYGVGRNGKTLFVETIKKVMGDSLCVVLSSDAIMDAGRTSNGPTPYLAMLKDMRLAFASESNEGRMLDASLVKRVTGSDTLSARPMYRDPISFRPTHKIALITNAKPLVSADDEALWDRLALIPFTQRFVDEPIYQAEHKRNPNLATELEQELPGILAWLVRGCLAWQKEGLNPPEVMKAETKDWRGNVDVLEDFLADKCEVNETHEIKARELYDAYTFWHALHDATGKKLDETAFGERMAKRFTRTRNKHGRIYRGVTLKAV